MPSEKSRYLNRNAGPDMPIDLTELELQLVSVDHGRLAHIIWCRAQEDDVLRKCAMLAAVFALPNVTWEQAKPAVEYALHFPDYVRYNEGGHGQVLDEIATAVESLAAKGHHELAARVRHYAAELGEAVAENFEDDWDWTSSLERMIKEKQIT